jgi:protein-disulfide isomerase
VYYKCSLVTAALALALLASPRDASAQIELTVYAAMVRGPAAAPVTIVEFSDYQ